MKEQNKNILEVSNEVANTKEKNRVKTRIIISVLIIGLIFGLGWIIYNNNINKNLPKEVTIYYYNNGNSYNKESYEFFKKMGKNVKEPLKIKITDQKIIRNIYSKIYFENIQQVKLAILGEIFIELDNGKELSIDINDDGFAYYNYNGKGSIIKISRDLKGYIYKLLNIKR